MGESDSCYQLSFNTFVIETGIIVSSSFSTLFQNKENKNLCPFFPFRITWIQNKFTDSYLGIERKLLTRVPLAEAAKDVICGGRVGSCAPRDGALGNN
jgi:hypothetical protein